MPGERPANESWSVGRTVAFDPGRVVKGDETTWSFPFSKICSALAPQRPERVFCQCDGSSHCTFASFLASHAYMCTLTLMFGRLNMLCVCNNIATRNANLRRSHHVMIQCQSSTGHTDGECRHLSVWFVKYDCTVRRVYSVPSHYTMCRIHVHSWPRLVPSSAQQQLRPCSLSPPNKPRCGTVPMLLWLLPACRSSTADEQLHILTDELYVLCRTSPRGLVLIPSMARHFPQFPRQCQCHPCVFHTAAFMKPFDLPLDSRRYFPTRAWLRRFSSAQTVKFLWLT
jgi:hypothetical protein